MNDGCSIYGCLGCLYYIVLAIIFFGVTIFLNVTAGIIILGLFIVIKLLKLFKIIKY